MKLITLTVAFLICASTASAQKGQPRIHITRPPPQAHVAPRRQALEREFRQRSEQVVREKLNLNEDQVARLRSVNTNIGTQRNALMTQERSVRSDLRDELAQGNAADQGKVAQLMTAAHDLQARRFALQQEEQEQLSGFMTPVQVAQYVGLQAQIRQRMRQMQQGQDGEQVAPIP